MVLSQRNIDLGGFSVQVAGTLEVLGDFGVGVILVANAALFGRLCGAFLDLLFLLLVGVFGFSDSRCRFEGAVVGWLSFLAAGPSGGCRGSVCICVFLCLVLGLLCLYMTGCCVCLLS